MVGINMHKILCSIYGQMHSSLCLTKVDSPIVVEGTQDFVLAQIAAQVGHHTQTDAQEDIDLIPPSSSYIWFNFYFPIIDWD